MRNIRLVARLDIKAPNLVKGIQFEGLRKLGDPHQFAKKYYLEGVDEIYYEDIVASLYERNSLLEIIEETTRDIFVPVTVGGGPVQSSVAGCRESARSDADGPCARTEPRGNAPGRHSRMLSAQSTRIVATLPNQRAEPNGSSSRIR